MAILTENYSQKSITEQNIFEKFLGGEHSKSGLWLLLATDTVVSRPFLVSPYQEYCQQTEEGQHQQSPFKIVGMVGVSVKPDQDMREPPNSVAVIDHLFVSPPYRGEQLGEEMLRTALSHCVEAGFRAVEMEIDDVQQRARKLCERLDWALDKMTVKSVFQIFKLESFTYRIACCQIKS